MSCYYGYVLCNHGYIDYYVYGYLYYVTMVTYIMSPRLLILCHHGYLYYVTMVTYIM